MENLRMPASYATLPEEELPEIFGGGELGDALDRSRGTNEMEMERIPP